MAIRGHKGYKIYTPIKTRQNTVPQPYVCIEAKLFFLSKGHNSDNISGVPSKVKHILHIVINSTPSFNTATHTV